MTMIDGISAVRQSPTSEAQSPSMRTLDLPSAPPQPPTAAQSGDFARAAAASIPDVPAALPSTQEGLGGRIERQANALAVHLNTLTHTKQAPDSAPTPGAEPRQKAVADHKEGMDKEKIDLAVSQMERAYIFAIETSLASRGSTETTKIFNTLLKGQ